MCRIRRTTTFLGFWGFVGLDTALEDILTDEGGGKERLERQLGPRETVFEYDKARYME